MQDAKLFLDKLRVNSIDIQTSIILDSINQLVTEYNSRVDYLSTWIISKPTLLSSVAESGSKFNSVIVGAAGLSTFVNKSVGFADNVSIKQKTSDKYMSDFSESEELSLITFDIGRIVNRDTDRLVE